MKSKRIAVTHCDACERQFRRNDQVIMMAFQPTGASFEVQYAVCNSCLPNIPQDEALAEHALTRAMNRDARFQLHLQARALAETPTAGGIQ